jgi:hypothetical protein
MLHLYLRGYVGHGLGSVWEMPDPIVEDRVKFHRDLEDQFDIVEMAVGQCGVYSKPTRPSLKTRGSFLKNKLSPHSIESKLSCRLCLNNLIGGLFFRRLCVLFLFFLGLLTLLCL